MPTAYIKLPDKISNEELWQRTKQAPIEQQIKGKKWHWTGNLMVQGRGVDQEQPSKAQ